VSFHLKDELKSSEAVARSFWDRKGSFWRQSSENRDGIKKLSRKRANKGERAQKRRQKDLRAKRWAESVV
jgi:hypothetical protein